MTNLLLQIGTRYTPWEVLRIIKRARRFAALREDREIDRWLLAIQFAR